MREGVGYPSLYAKDDAVFLLLFFDCFLGCVQDTSSFELGSCLR